MGGRIAAAATVGGMDPIAPSTGAGGGSSSAARPLFEMGRDEEAHAGEPDRSGRAKQARFGTGAEPGRVIGGSRRNSPRTGQSFGAFAGRYWNPRRSFPVPLSHAQSPRSEERRVG